MEQFEHSGVWWDATAPATRWSGKLRFDPIDGAVLAVTLPNNVTGFARRVDEYDTIFGHTTDGKDVTLLRCFDTLSTGALGKPDRREIFANAVLVGFHAQGPDPLVSAANVVYRHVPAWWGPSGISVDDTVNWPDATIHFRRQPPVLVYSAEGVEIKIYSILPSLPASADETGAFPLREEVRLELRTGAPRPLSEVDRLLNACRDLLSIACQRYCSVERLAVFDAVREHPNGATFHAVPKFKRLQRASNRSAPDFLFTFSDIKHRAAEAFTAWITNAEHLRPARALYFLSVYGDNFVEGRFLALAQAVEAFHRRFRGGNYMAEAAFKTGVADVLLPAIPASLDPSLQDALRSRIKYGNEYSLRKRLALMCEEHKRALDAVAPNISRFIGPIVDLRNLLTHFPPEADEAYPKDEEWWRYNFILRVLLEFSFLKIMGFTDDEVRNLAARCGDYQAWSRRLFGTPKAP